MHDCRRSGRSDQFDAADLDNIIATCKCAPLPGCELFIWSVPAEFVGLLAHQTALRFPCQKRDWGVEQNNLHIPVSMDLPVSEVPSYQSAEVLNVLL